MVYDSSLVGTATGPCPESGVEWMRVTAAAATVDVSCQEWSAADQVSVQGILVADLPPGTQDVRVRGYRGGVVVHDPTVSVTVIANARVEEYVSVEPVQAAVELYAYLAWGDPVADYSSCASAGNPNISYALYDGLQTLIDEGVVGCGDPLPTFVYGELLDLDDYTVRTQGIATSGPASGQVVFDSCGVGFDHFSAQTGTAGVPVDLLTLPVPTCG